MAKLAENFMEQQIGLRVFDELIPTLMYMDDAAILADDRAQLQEMLRMTEQWAEKEGMTISI